MSVVLRGMPPARRSRQECNEQQPQRLHLPAADSTCCVPLAVLLCRRCMLHPSCLATSCAAWTSGSSWPSRWGPAAAEGGCCCWECARGKAALSTAHATRALWCDT